MRTLGGGGEMACQLTVELPAYLRSNGFKTFTRFRRRHRVHVPLRSRSIASCTEKLSAAPVKLKFELGVGPLRTGEVTAIDFFYHEDDKTPGVQKSNGLPTHRPFGNWKRNRWVCAC
jgi:hypothetical protein